MPICSAPMSGAWPRTSGVPESTSRGREAHQADGHAPVLLHRLRRRGNAREAERKLDHVEVADKARFRAISAPSMSSNSRTRLSTSNSTPPWSRCSFNAMVFYCRETRFCGLETKAPKRHEKSNRQLAETKCARPALPTCPPNGPSSTRCLAFLESDPHSNRVSANPGLRFRETGSCGHRQRRRKSASDSNGLLQRRSAHIEPPPIRGYSQGTGKYRLARECVVGLRR
jgi:hypothetical protein